MVTKSHSINGIPEETLDLLQDARRRAERETGYTLPFQAFLRKILQDAAEAERLKQSSSEVLQQAASEEYAQQQSEDARS